MSATARKVVREDQRSRVIDMRGRVHELCEAGSLADVSENRRLRRLLFLAHRHRWMFWLRILQSVLGVIAIATLAFMARAMNWYFVTAHLTSVWLGVAVTIFASKGAIEASAMQAVLECLKAEVCPGCGYSVRGLEEDADGNRVCPECGGAWKVGTSAPPTVA